MKRKFEMKRKLEIRPAIPSEERHKIEDVLKSMGYKVWGSGTDSDLSSCSISFDGVTTEHLFSMRKEKT